LVKPNSGPEIPLTELPNSLKVKMKKPTSNIFEEIITNPFIGTKSGQYSDKLEF
jgi:hypothetical protein